MSQMTVSSSINTIRDIMAQLTSSVATKLILAMIIVTLLPLALLGVVTNITSANALREQAGESFADHAARTATQIGQALVENVRLIETLANIEPLYVRIEAANASYSGSDSDIQNQILQLDAQWVAAPDSDPLIQNALSDDDEINFIAHQLRDFQQQFPRHVELFATDRYGALVGSTDRTSDYYQADEGWWLAALCQFTLSGSPIVYNGTEVGVSQRRGIRDEGSHGMEESRQPMRWGAEQNADLRDYFRWLIGLRREGGKVWSNGRLQTHHLNEANQTYAYSRSHNNIAFAVAFNLSDATQTIPLAPNQTITLPPRQGTVKQLS